MTLNLKILSYTIIFTSFVEIFSVFLISLFYDLYFCSIPTAAAAEIVDDCDD